MLWKNVQFVHSLILDKIPLESTRSCYIYHIRIGAHESALFSYTCTLEMGNSRKYPYPTTDGFHVLTPPCLRKFQNALPPTPSEFHNREPLLPFGISGFFLEVHFRLGNVYMNKRTWIYASQRLWSSGTRWQALLFSDNKNLPTACGQAVQPFF